MNLLVCVKYSADPSEGDRKYCTNPFDLFAMEMAARIKDSPGARIFALTHGDAASETALRDCAAIGADRVYRVCGQGDSAQILAEAITEIERQEGNVSAIFCGDQSIDGGSHYVGPALAELLHRSLVTAAMDACTGDGELQITREGAHRNFVLGVPYPCVITVTKPLFSVRQPTVRARLAANRIEAGLLQAAEAGAGDGASRGFTYADPPAKAACVFLEGGPAGISGTLLQTLTQWGIL